MSRDTSFHLLRSKLETVEGTDAVPTSANDMQILAPSFSRPTPAFPRPRDSVAKGSGSRQAHRPAPPNGHVITWSDAVHLRGTRDGAAYAAANLPEADPWLVAGGFSRTVDTTPGAETVTYGLTLSPAESLTDYRYEDGQLRKMLAGKAVNAFEIAAGLPLTLTSTRTGLYGGVSTAATPASGAFGTTVAPVMEGLSVDIGGFADAIIRSLSFTSGFGGPVQRGSVNAANGLAPHRLRGLRKIPFTIVLEEPTLTDLDLEGHRDACTAFSLATGVIGAAQYNRFAISAPAFIIDTFETADDAGIPVATLNGFLYDSTVGGNDALLVTFS